jgi:hypothetical protein
MTTMSPTDCRRLRSELHAQDVAWRMGYRVGLEEGRKRRTALAWRRRWQRARRLLRYREVRWVLYAVVLAFAGVAVAYPLWIGLAVGGLLMAVVGVRLRRRCG